MGEKTLNDLQPGPLWNHFQSICDIPHPSKHEEKIIEFVRNFATNLGLATIVDEVGNIIVKKAATPGMENRKTVVLQSHLDMVPQKNSDTPHNFETDPIQAYVDGDVVRAKGTTLGADNGIGVAMMMAIMEAKDLKHGPMEFLFTVDEETGMTGAFGLKPRMLEADVLINLDTEDEGELYIGCAGGVDTLIDKDYEQINMPENHAALEVNLKGLKGGHSGCDIHLGRGNSNKLLVKLLSEAREKLGLQLGKFEGGTLRNAIPRESFATVIIPSDKKDEFAKMVTEYEAKLKQDYAKVDPNLILEVKETNWNGKVMKDEEAKNFFAAINNVHDGVYTMCADMPDVVETSSNLAIVTVENGHFNIHTSQRSSAESGKEEIRSKISKVFEEIGAKVESKGSYPGWAPDVNSPILETMKGVYKNLFNKEALVKVVHAGLECGLLRSLYPNMDCISIGPDIHFPHSPDEQVNIATVQKVWDFLLESLKEAPLK